MKNKKSQAAMEFFMTYGWAILAILIAVFAIIYFWVLPDIKEENKFGEVCILKYPNKCVLLCFDNQGNNRTIFDNNPIDLRVYLEYSCDIECDMEKTPRYRLTSCDEDFSELEEFVMVKDIK